MKLEPTSPPAIATENRLSGLILGTAVGDALGLPAENMTPERIRALWAGEWRMRFAFGRGMISDDTEHTLMVSQSLLEHPLDASGFQKALAGKLRWWFAGLPAGVGLATARACLKMWLGFPLEKCGVNSAGAGPAMRSAIIGAYFANDPERRREFVLRSTRLTHRDWRAEAGALAVAEAAALAVSGNRQIDISLAVELISGVSEKTEWAALAMKIRESLARGDTVAVFAELLGLKKGVTGYSLHVVPVAIYAWLRHPADFRGALIAALEAGGDTDTVGAVVGALAGASVGESGIPDEWRSGIFEWPRSVKVMRQIADRLSEQQKAGRAAEPVRYAWAGIIPRNLVFLCIVLAHGIRRLAPPYGKA